MQAYVGGSSVSYDSDSQKFGPKSMFPSEPRRELRFQISRHDANFRLGKAPESLQPDATDGSELCQEETFPSLYPDNPNPDPKLKQSHFFNSLFPSRANRFGYPVYPERDFGIPSMGGPVSFAGFSPPGSVFRPHKNPEMAIVGSAPSDGSYSDRR